MFQFLDPYSYADTSLMSHRKTSPSSENIGK